MDGLDDFERQLAAEKAEREKTEHRKHRHHHHKHSSRRARDDDDDGHRSKRRRRSAERDRDEKHDKRNRDEKHDDSKHRRSHVSDDERDKRDSHHVKDSKHKHSKHKHVSDDEEHSRHEHSKDKRDSYDKKDSKHRRNSHDEQDKPTQESPRPHLTRDAWMTAPSALDVDYIHRQQPKPAPRREPAPRIPHARELNHGLDAAAAPATTAYTFGDAGSAWRMTKLRGVYDTAQREGRDVDAVATERYGSLHAFDDAREEELEMDRRQRYGAGYKGKNRPTGEIYRARNIPDAESAHESTPEPEEAHSQQQEAHAQQAPTPNHQAPPMDATALNRLRARMIKAKFQRAPNASQLEEEYTRAAAHANTTATPTVILGPMHNRLLAGTSRRDVVPASSQRARNRGAVVENQDMSIADMVSHERRTRGTPTNTDAQRIMRDASFRDSLEYLDDNAARLARRVEQSGERLRGAAIEEWRRADEAVRRCHFCYQDDGNDVKRVGGNTIKGVEGSNIKRVEENNKETSHHEIRNKMPVAPVIALATRIYLSIAPEPQISPPTTLLVPLAHHANLLACDDDEWLELRNFMKSLTRLHAAHDRDVVFYEDAVRTSHRHHAVLVAAPVPRDALAPAHFREAFLASGSEWAQHAKVIDTGGTKGNSASALRRAIARQAPYFHVWFDLDGGMAHIADDASAWPRDFARGVLGGIVGADAHLVSRTPRWGGPAQKARVDDFKKAWEAYDWTKLLIES